MATIKIIDDDVEIAENLATLLSAEGHTVSTRDETKGAAAELEANTPDVLVLDVMFPDNPAAGFDLAREIRESTKLKNLPIVMLTGVNQEYPMDFSGADIDQEWMPVQEFMEKPVEIKGLLARIDKLLGKA